MRTTMNTIYNRIHANLNTLTEDLNSINNRISSGYEMSRISDNPVNMVSALNLRSSIAEISQYEVNLQYGGSMIDAAESALTQIKEQVIEAKTLAIKAQNPAVEVNRIEIAPSVRNLLEQSVTLANSQINGKYIFGGFRTTGYTDAEPTPFIHDHIDGYRLNGVTPSTASLFPQDGVVQDGTDLPIIGPPLETLEFFYPATGLTEQVVGPVDLTNPASTINGINMLDASNLVTAINTDTNITASLTTQIGGTTAATTNSTGAAVAVSFDVTGTPPATGAPTTATVNVNLPQDATPNEVAHLTVQAINSVSSTTGVMAVRGNGANGGAPNSIIFRNVDDGNSSGITVTTPAGLPIGVPTADVILGFDNTISLAGPADATHNTGEVFLSAATEFTFGNTTNNVLTISGLDDNTVAVSALDVYGNPTLYTTHNNTEIGLQDLKINGIYVPATQDDGISTIDPLASAAAKATAVNSVAGQTGVSAEITPAAVNSSFALAIQPGFLSTGDVVINGVDIFNVTVANQIPVVGWDLDSTIVDAINARQADTGVFATHTPDGALALQAVDGRNIHVETSAAGEGVTHLNGEAPPAASDKIYYGQVQLYSNRTFMLESPAFGINNYEPGLMALGLDGGTATTGEVTDVAGDGKVSALTFADFDGNVRYAGERDNVLEVKVGKVEKIAVSQNGQVALKDTHVFDALQRLEDALLEKNFTEVTGLQQATDINATFASGNTGLPDDPLFHDPIIQDGSFQITITDRDHYPPVPFDVEIAVDINVDTPATIAAKINAIPHMDAAWNVDGYLEINTTDPDRYTMNIHTDTSQFTNVVQVSTLDMQVHAIDNSIAELDQIMGNLTTQISDLGARANRIIVQEHIFTNLKLTTQENLSEKQDTDMIKAIMDLQATEVAYQAALSSAAKTMQLSLVDYLN